MDQNIEQEEIRPLLFNYIFHIILFILYLVLHLIVNAKLFWVIDSLGVIFLVFSYFHILYFTFPIYPLIIILKKKFNKKNFFLLKILTLILIIIVEAFGLILSVVFLINTIKSKAFYKECPFYLSIDHLKEVFGPDFSNKAKSKCDKRRCVFDRENLNEQYPFYYLCNYDPTDEFDEDETYTRINENGDKISANKQLICTSVANNYNLLSFSHSELYSYLDLCWKYADFYRCKRFNKPEEDYDLDLDTECPDETYLILVFILCVLLIILDIIIAFLPWGLEYLTFKKLLIILGINRRKANSNCSTERSSEISQDEEDFKKEVTPVIIVEPEIKNNDLILNIDNIDNDVDSEIEVKLRSETIKVNKINLHKREKNIYSPKDINKMQTSERNRLKSDAKDTKETKENELNINKEHKNINININKKRKINYNQQNSTVTPSRINPIEIQIDNENSNS